MPDDILFRPQPLIFRVRAPEVHTDLVRERLMDMVKLRLQKMQRVNGYLTDFGLNVHRGMLIIQEPIPIPCVNFWDADEQNQKTQYGLQENLVTVVVASYDKREILDDPNNPDELCTPAVNIIADIEYAVHHHAETQQKDVTFDGLVSELAYNSNAHVSGLQPELWIQTVSTFLLTYTTRIGDPFQSVAA